MKKTPLHSTTAHATPKEASQEKLLGKRLRSKVLINNMNTLTDKEEIKKD